MKSFGKKSLILKLLEFYMQVKVGDIFKWKDGSYFIVVDLQDNSFELDICILKDLFKTYPQFAGSVSWLNIKPDWTKVKNTKLNIIRILYG